MSTATATTPNPATRRGTDTPAPPREPLAPRRIGPVDVLRHSLTVLWRTLVKVKRNPEQLGDLFIQPIIFLVLFVYIFGGAVGGSTHDYLQFALPGLMVQTAMFASMGLGLTLNNDITKGVFDRFRSLPMARSAPLFGAVLADLIRYVLSLAILLGMGAILGFRIGTNPLAALAGCLLIVVFVTAASWLSVLVGLIAKSPQTVQIYGFGLMFPLTFASNVFVPTGTLPGWLQAWVKINPVSELSTAARGLLVGGPVSHHAVVAMLWAAALVLVFVPLSLRIYRRKV